MSKNRLSMVFAVVTMAAVVLAGFFVGVQPQLAQAASSRAQQVDVDRTNASSRAELARLRKQAEKLPAMRDELERLQASVPATASMSRFYGELYDVAGATGVTVSSITTDDAVPYTPPAAEVESSATGSAAAAPSASPSATASAAPSSEASASATPTTPAPPTTFTNPVINSSNMSLIPVTVSVDGTFDQARQFVAGTQSGERLFLINEISSAESSGAATEGAEADASAGQTWTFGGYVYVLTTDADTAAKG